MRPMLRPSPAIEVAGVGLKRMYTSFCRTRIPRPRSFSAVTRIAQPLPGTHPHLMASGELTPGIAADEYARRRERLANSLPPGSLALFPSSPLAYMAHDVPFPYHQDTDLLYLCGLLEPSSLLACVKPADASARWHLFVRPTCANTAMWDGPRAGVEGAQRYFVPDGAAHALDDAPRVLHGALWGGGSESISTLYYAPKANPAIDTLLRPVLRDAPTTSQLTPQPATPLVQRLRVIKSPAEVSLLQRSANLCADAMNATMKASTAAAAGNLTEVALAAHFEFECRLAGAERLAYPCVVAGGVNAVTLHYMHNNALLSADQMVLMDAGASLHGYASDLTRTWPLDGRFSAEQRLLYEAVLDVNERIINLCVLR